MFPVDNLLVRLRRLAEAAPDTRLYTFLGDDGEVEGTLEAGSLVLAADRVAAQLRAAGLREGDRVLLVDRPGLDFVRGLVGCLMAGVLPAPVFPPAPFQKGPEGRMLTRVAADARAAALLSTRLFVEACLSDPEAELPALPWICTDEASEVDGVPWATVTGETVAFLQYTSGSTGNPKGVCITHGNLLDQLSMYRQELQFGPEARLVFWVPPYHDLGLISGILAVLAGHGQAIMMSPLSFLRRPAAWAEAIVAFRATHVAAPNFAYDLLVRKTTLQQRAAWDFRSLRVVLSGGESIRPATVRRFLTAFASSGLAPESWCSAYGLAEHTVGVTVGGRHLIWVDPVFLDQGRLQVIAETDDLTATPPPATVGLMSCGSPRSGVGLRIVDPTSGAVLAPGQVGEIWAHSASKAAGYYGRPQESAATFGARLEGRTWLRTGDLGAIHAGELYICGRLKDLVIVGGRKIHPQDVEDSLRDAHPKLRPGCTVVFAGEPGESGLVEGLVVLAELNDTTTTELRGEVEASIRDVVRRHHRLACAAVVVGAPGMVLKTTSGKLRRGACADAWRAGLLVGVVAPGAPPPDAPVDLLALLRGTLAQVLGRAPTGIPADRPIGELGASSLQLVDFTERLEQRLGRPIASTLPFDAPTLAEMAALLAGRPPRLVPPTPTDTVDSLCIVGIGCRFAGGVTDLSSLEDLLRSEREVMEEVPAARWDLGEWFDPTPGRPGKISSRWGGWIHGIESFEAEFFDLSPAEAPAVDPQERLLLETAWEALEQVGLRRDELVDASTGVFVGISGNDYQARLLRQPGGVDAHSLLGTAHSAIAGRLSYWLGLRGPSMAIDTACSSSLVALHQACNAIRAGDCAMALVAGVNVVLAPEGSVALSRLGVLSTSGRCNSFSAQADGYVRADGAVVVVVERLADARRRGHPVLAVIRATAVSQDGRRSSFTAPNGQAQRQLLRVALERAALRPDEVDAVECHGTGTILGDPVEVGALAGVFGPGRTRPLWIGSVKSSLGHTEAAAGLAGVAGALVALRTGCLPASKHALPLNPRIPWGEIPIRVATTPVEGVAVLGVSSFGLTGTSAHVILQRPPPEEPGLLPTARTAELVVYSAGSAEALSAGAAKLLHMLPDSLGDLAWSTATTRTAQPFRLALVARSVPELAEKLQKFRPGPSARTELPLACLYSGAGVARASVGRELATVWPVFQAALLDACAACAPHLATPLADHLWEPATWTQPGLALPAGFCVDWALTALWRSWGAKPSWVAGYSTGEISAATAAGLLSLEDGATLVCRWARLLEARSGSGAIYQVRAPEQVVRAEMEPYASLVSVVAVLGSRSVWVGGEAKASAALADIFASKAIVSRRVAIGSSLYLHGAEDLGAALAREVGEVKFRAPLLDFISAASDFDALLVPTVAQWVARLAGTQRLDAVVRRLDTAGARAFLEIGADAFWSPLIPGILTGPPPLCQPSLRGGVDENVAMLEALGAWFRAGGAVDWAGVFPEGGRRVPLPTTVWQRQRAWVEAVPRAAPEVHESVPRSARSVSEITAALVDLLSKLTGRRPAPRTPLVELGMDSLMGLELRTRLDAALGVRLPLSLIWQDLCVEELAQVIVEAEERQAIPTHGLLVPILIHQPGRPIFFLPPIHGTVHVYQGVAAGLGGPVWGLRASGLEAGEEPQSDLAKMAEDFLARVRKEVPHGPLRLVGYSFGAAVAQAMAARDDVEKLVLIDGAAPRAMPVTDEVVLQWMGEAFGLPLVRSRLELVDLLRAQQLFPERELLPQLERVEAVLRSHLRAWTSYEPQRSRGRAWLLRSTEGPPGGPPEVDLGWKNYVDGLEVLDVGGDHRTVLRRSVAQLRQILES